LERQRVNTVLLVTSDAGAAARFAALVPPPYNLEVRGGTREALEFFDLERPDLFVVDSQTAGLGDPGFLRAFHERFSSPPPVLLLSRGPLGESVKTAARALQVREILPETLGQEAVRLLKPYFALAGSVSMTILEFLASGFLNPSHRQVALRSGGYELSFVFGKGYLWAMYSPLFYHQYVLALRGAGISVNDAEVPVDPVTLAALEEKLQPPTPELVAVKKQTLLGTLASLPLDANFEATILDENIPEGLIPLEIPELVVSLVDHVPEDALAVLKHPSVRLRASEGVIPEDLPILPHQGYLLSQCQTPRAVSGLLQTGIMPEPQVLGGLYALLLLGLVVVESKASKVFSLSRLRLALEDEDTRVRRQSEVIRNLVQALSMPGGAPHQILGIPSDAKPAEAIRAFEGLLERLRTDRLHPEVAKVHQRDLIFLRAKLNESLLILESAYLSEQKKRGEAGAEGEGPQAGGRDPAMVERGKREASKLLARAKELYDEGMTYEALQHLNLAVFHHAELAEAHNMIARILMMKPNQKSLFQAQSAFLQAVHLAPGNIDYLLDAADFFCKQGLFNRCRGFLDRAWEIDPKNPRLVALFESLRAKTKHG
jgi:tetratricopeptide (TPR) repeat protein